MTKVCGASVSFSTREKLLFSVYPAMRIGVAKLELVCRALRLSATESWTPWEFERACRNLSHRLSATVKRVETGAVEERSEVAAR